MQSSAVPRHLVTRPEQKFFSGRDKLRPGDRGMPLTDHDLNHDLNHGRAQENKGNEGVADA